MKKILLLVHKREVKEENQAKNLPRKNLKNLPRKLKDLKENQAKKDLKNHLKKW